MKVGFVVIAYNQAEPLVRLCDSIRSRHMVEGHVFIHSRILRVIEAADRVMGDNKGWHLYDYRFNRGVARGWNDGILACLESGCQVVVVSNDDLWFGAGDFDNLVRTADENRDHYAVTAHGYHTGLNKRTDHGFAIFAVTSTFVGKLGCFDENFFPAYREDTDLARRAWIAGLEKLMIDTNIHHVGSATINTNPLLRLQNHTTHNLNNEYYKLKWGGIDGTERFIRPFNNAEFHPYYISKHDRHNPYPGFNRTDFDIVNL